MGDRIFFTTDSTSLTAKSRGTLDKQAAWLGKYSNHSITLEGHADERGTREYNLGLGQRRAVAARDYLASRGVTRSRVKVISFGKERPVAVVTIFPAGLKTAGPLPCFAWQQLNFSKILTIDGGCEGEFISAIFLFLSFGKFSPESAPQ